MRQPKPEDVRAAGAFRWTSMNPENREQGEINSYIGKMERVRAEFDQWRTDENSADMDADLEDYRSRYVQKLNAYLAAHSRCASQFVTGAGGWTGRMVRANRKRNDTADRRLHEYIEWSEKRLDRLRNRYDPKRIARRPIGSHDADAIERLQDKIEAAEALQETMKAANKICRSTKLSDEEKIAELQELEGIGEAAAHKLLQPDYMGRIGFPSYSLSNNNASIRRMKGRIEEIQAIQQLEDVEEERQDGIVYREDTDAGRVQIEFPDKPSAAVRKVLKSNGFRWAPSLGVWQRHLNANGIDAAQRVLRQIEGM